MLIGLAVSIQSSPQVIHSNHYKKTHGVDTYLITKQTYTRPAHIFSFLYAFQIRSAVVKSWKAKFRSVSLITIRRVVITTVFKIRWHYRVEIIKEVAVDRL
jgi:hypothetical protein